jgi:predicted transcriptional regulator
MLAASVVVCAKQQRLPMKQRILKAVTVRFEEPVRTALEEIAEREHRTLAEQVRYIVARSLAEQDARAA